MNKRILELAAEAGADIWGDKVAASQYFDIEKFAELIAYECMDLALGSSHREDDMGAIIANKIKKHFGVE
jgi:hypothetical protein